MQRYDLLFSNSAMYSLGIDGLREEYNADSTMPLMNVVRLSQHSSKCIYKKIQNQVIFQNMAASCLLITLAMG